MFFKYFYYIFSYINFILSCQHPDYETDIGNGVCCTSKYFSLDNNSPTIFPTISTDIDQCPKNGRDIKIINVYIICNITIDWELLIELIPKQKIFYLNFKSSCDPKKFCWNKCRTSKINCYCNDLPICEVI